MGEFSNDVSSLTHPAKIIRWDSPSGYQVAAQYWDARGNFEGPTDEDIQKRYPGAVVSDKEDEFIFAGLIHPFTFYGIGVKPELAADYPERTARVLSVERSKKGRCMANLMAEMSAAWLGVPQGTWHFGGAYGETE